LKAHFMNFIKLDVSRGRGFSWIPQQYANPDYLLVVLCLLWS
jgi:hypothetical protein